MDKFYKCDLHVHPSSCYSRSYLKEDFIKAIFEFDIEVFSITDHNIIDKSIYDELKSKTGKLLILGTELNVHLSEEVIKRNNLNTSNKKYW